jgi:phenylpropionate dioxygenase-like ring-hydroxylating dioxygenase large terminal subunit
MDMETDPLAKHRTLASDLGLSSAVVNAGHYTSHEIYEAERERIFRRAWLLVGRENEVANPGDFVRRSIPTLEAEAIVVRGQDGIVRAFHNSCAHRGATLVNQCEGRTHLFVCPYHAWSYGTDGRCRAIPGAEFFPQIEKSQIGLAPIHADVWNGFVFLNFDETPRHTLAEFLGAFGEQYSDLPFGQFNHAIEYTLDIETNWKCVADAFAEGYHVSTIHKKTLPMVPSGTNPFNVFYDVRLWPPHFSFITQVNPDWTPNGQIVKFIYSTTGSTLARFKPSGASDEQEFGPLTDCQSINPIGLPNFGLSTLAIFPSTGLFVFADRYFIQQFWPLGVNKTRLVMRFYFRNPPASHLEAFAEAHMRASGRDVVTEDVAMTSIQHHGLKGGGIRQLHLGENELLIRFTHEMIEEWLADGEHGAAESGQIL